MPVRRVPLVDAMWWHPIYNSDPEHAWLRDVFAEAGKFIDESWNGVGDVVSPDDLSAARM